MKRYLALTLLAVLAGCGSGVGSTDFTFDDSIEASKQFTNFGETIVWEQSSEYRPWGLENGRFFRLVWDKPLPEIVFQPPASFVLNKKVVCSDIFKGIYATSNNQGLYVKLEKNQFFLMFFDGKTSRNVFDKPLNGTVVQIADMTKPACRIVWDDWNKKFVFTAALGSDYSIARYAFDPANGQVEKGATGADSFVPVPDDGYVIENTNSYELGGNLVDFAGKALVLKGCLLRYDPVTKQSFYLAQGKLYKLVGGKPVMIGEMPKQAKPGFFGVLDGEPFVLVQTGQKNVRIEYFKQ